MIVFYEENYIELPAILILSEIINFFRGLFWGLKHGIRKGHTVRRFVVILPGYEKYRIECICGDYIEFIYE